MKQTSNKVANVHLIYQIFSRKVMNINTQLSVIAPCVWV